MVSFQRFNFIGSNSTGDINLIDMTFGLSTLFYFFYQILYLFCDVVGPCWPFFPWDLQPFYSRSLNLISMKEKSSWKTEGTYIHCIIESVTFS